MARRKKQDNIRRMKPAQGNFIRKLSKTNRRRLFLVFFFVIVCFIILIGRLIYLNAVRGENSKLNVMSILNYDSTTIPYERGKIMDRNKTVLAASEKIYTLILAPKTLSQASDPAKAQETAVDLLYNYFSISKDETRKILKEQADSYYVVLKKNITYDEKAPYNSFLASENEEDKKARNLVGEGIWFEESYKRVYPYSTLAADVIGFTSSDNKGLWGLENYYNDTLSGVAGRTYNLLDNNTNLEEIMREPQNGNNLVTTIDSNIQRITEKYINQFNNKIGAENVAAVVMDPNNGEMLAMASTPGFDLNDPHDLTAAGYSEEQQEKMSSEEQSELLNSIWKNYCVNDSYEPGSTAKTMTVSYALDQDLVSDADEFNCTGGLTYNDGTFVKCNEVHGKISLQEAVMYSCNVAMMKISDLIGKDNFLKMQHMFGIGQRTGIDLPGEVDCSSVIYNEKTLGPVERWTSAFGQGFNMSMVQMASAFSSIVNGGNYYKPHVVSEIENAGGSVVEVFDKTLMRTTVSRQTSDWMKEALYQTVEEGTGHYAKVPGYKIGGKTGTSEVGDRSGDDCLVSFIAAAPIDNPQVVVYVIVDRPHVENQGQSSFASKIVCRILTEVLPYLKIFPTEPVDENYSAEYQQIIHELDDLPDISPLTQEEESESEQEQTAESETDPEQESQESGQSEETQESESTETEEDSGGETEQTLQEGQTGSQDEEAAQDMDADEAQ